MTKTQFTLGAAGIAATLLLGATLPALADTDTGTPTNSTVGTSTRAQLEREQEMKLRALYAASTSAERALHAASLQKFAQQAGDREIDARVANLNRLLARVNAMVRLTADQKAAIAAIINSQITLLNTLKSKIDADIASSTLKTDLQSITKDYRIYGLVEPQINVLAAADRAGSIVDMLTAMSAKLASRVATSTNAATLQPLLDDLNAKIADAKTQAQAAVSETATLKPDQGDATVMAANLAALKDARMKLKAAQLDLNAAAKDVRQILLGLRGVKLGNTASTSPENH
ncbi:hypothetical protein HY091_00500 [Candidatus Kaiserbacteria bacterium]|nr:hypothetical protein [Candidatus Kaiserbacteria bacterium]